MGKYSTSEIETKKKVDNYHEEYKRLAQYLTDVETYVEDNPTDFSTVMHFANLFAVFLQLYHKHVRVHVTHNRKTDVFDYIFLSRLHDRNLNRDVAIMGYTFESKRFAIISFDGLKEADDMRKQTQYDQFYYPTEMHCTQISFLDPDKMAIPAVKSLVLQAAQLNLNIIGDTMEQLEIQIKKNSKHFKLFTQKMQKKYGYTDAFQNYYDRILTIQDRIGFFK